ncbi:MAG: endonuclease/exonuclease/phosphatase family protein, partial [Clostridia bacterium]|nr:endonuclease/exonuclease/phosphatase family protein [Clostridia bacterium]
VRMKGHIQIFKDLMPDIVGGQEVNIDMQMLFKFYCLEENLPYTIVWGNMTPLIYRADKFELLDTEYILYPATVADFEGKFNDANSKSLNLGVFRDKQSGKVFIFATTHLWWMSDERRPGSSEVRRRQIKQATELLAKYQQKYDNCPIIFVGDMNARFNSPAIQYALGEGGYSHAYHLATDYRFEERGYNACGPKAPGTWQHTPFETAIDHILVKDIPEGAISRFDRYCPDYYLTVSDHAPAYIDITF